jgi:hypothetical protein
MIGYEQLLYKAIDKALMYGKKIPPTLLLQHLSSINDPLAVANDFDKTNDLFATLEQEFATLCHKHHPNFRVTDDDFECLTGLIRWLKTELEQFYDREPSVSQLIAYLTTAAFLDHGRLLWRELPLRKAQCQGFFTVIKRLIEKANTRYFLRGVQAPIWEQETVDLFNTADDKGDFIEIDRLWISLQNAIMPNFLLHQAVLCLAYNNFHLLVEASRSVKQTFVVMCIADALPTKMCYQLSFTSTNDWICFFCLYYSLKKEKGRPAPHRNTKRLLINTLCKIAQDREIWMKAMVVFNKYPMRYPSLQASLGKALAKVSLSALDNYVNAIQLDSNASGREEIAVCLHSFRYSATQEQRRELFMRCYQRWQTFMEVKPNRDRPYFTIFVTALDYGVIAYLSECAENEKMKVIIDSIYNQINDIGSYWHQNKMECITTFNMLLSRLQPYYMALETCNIIKNLSKKKVRIPDKLVQDRYIQLMFECKWNNV